MLEVMSLEVPAESVRTVAGAQLQRVPGFRRCDREATSPNAVRANGKINRLVLEDPIGNEQECESTRGSVNMQAVSNTKY